MVVRDAALVAALVALDDAERAHHITVNIENLDWLDAAPDPRTFEAGTQAELLREVDRILEDSRQQSDWQDTTMVDEHHRTDSPSPSPDSRPSEATQDASGRLPQCQDTNVIDERLPHTPGSLMVCNHSLGPHTRGDMLTCVNCVAAAIKAMPPTEREVAEHGHYLPTCDMCVSHARRRLPCMCQMEHECSCCLRTRMRMMTLSPNLRQQGTMGNGICLVCREAAAPVETSERLCGWCYGRMPEIHAVAIRGQQQTIEEDSIE